MTAFDTELPLAADFEPATRDEWRALVSAVLARSAGAARGAEADPEDRLATTTYDGISLRPLYTADDAPAGWSAELPGVAPFRRGATVDGAAATGWDVRQWHSDGDAARLNQALLSDLENGVTSLWLTLGTSALAVADLDTALQGVYLDLAPIALDAGAVTEVALRALLAVADSRRVPRAELRISAGADPIGLLARAGVEADLGVFGRILGLADGAGLVAGLVDGTVYHDAGGSDSDELAVATAVGVAYLRALTDAGLGVADALDQLEFRFAVTDDQFTSIAKLRAARLMWARVAELSGVAEPVRGQRQHAVTSRAMLTRRDPWVNMLRTTIACFSAAVGGADAITVLPFDSAIGRSDDFARRIARNTQSVLHDEASLARVVDPAGGSYYVETYTDQLADVGWTKFTAIERAGGAHAALRDGSIPALLGETRERRRAAVAKRRDALTGVSEFAFIDESPVTRAPRPAPAGGGVLPVIRYAEEFEELRDRSDAHLARTGSRPTVFLAEIGTPAVAAARSGFAANLFQAGGIGCPSGAGNASELAERFATSGATAACLCSTDKVYDEQAAAVAAALAAAGARTIYLAGRPGERAESDRAAGIAGHVYAGVDAVAVLQSILTDLGVQ